tara:strand:- start:14993 stop:15496 length:504 start_codon:yes stop_codon:yes gene_type:complete
MARKRKVKQKVEELIRAPNKEKIECSFRKFPKHLMAKADGEKTREGKYHGTYFWAIKGFGWERWVVATHIVGVDFDKLLGEGMTGDEIVEGCLAHLNALPKRKKYAKKEPKRPYGNLDVYKHTFHESWNDDGEKYISVLLSIDQRKNKKFWGEGKKVFRHVKMKRAK